MIMRLNRKVDASALGFSLIELSIVIIIIGLLIAGIAAGSSMVKQSSLNSIIIEEQNYITAINSFKSRFNALPGDFANAGSIWPNCDPSPQNCNGNNNGLIEWQQESLRAWQQLEAAGMIGGQFNGTSNEPIAKYGSGTFWRIESNTDNIYTVQANTKNSLEILSSTMFNFISSADAYYIDKRIDDGVPSNGLMYTLDESPTGCVLQADGVTPAFPTTYPSTRSSYNLSQTTPGCTKLYFYLNY